MKNKYGLRILNKIIVLAKSMDVLDHVLKSIDQEEEILKLIWNLLSGIYFSLIVGLGIASVSAQSSNQLVVRILRILFIISPMIFLFLIAYIAFKNELSYCKLTITKIYFEKKNKDFGYYLNLYKEMLFPAFDTQEDLHEEFDMYSFPSSKRTSFRIMMLYGELTYSFVKLKGTQFFSQPFSKRGRLTLDPRKISLVLGLIQILLLNALLVFSSFFANQRFLVRNEIVDLVFRVFFLTILVVFFVYTLYASLKIRILYNGYLKSRMDKLANSESYRSKYPQLASKID